MKVIDLLKKEVRIGAQKTFARVWPLALLVAVPLIIAEGVNLYRKNRSGR